MPLILNYFNEHKTTRLIRVIFKLFLSSGLISIMLLPQLVLGASFEFNPASNQFVAGCKNSLNIMVDATGKDSNAADIELYYNPNEIDIVDSVSSIAGTQIKPGDAYETYFGNDINTSTGRIRLAGASFVSSLSSRKVFATIEFTSKAGITSTNFTIKFDGVGATLDSNIADASTSDDLLTSVTNGTYTFKTGECTADKVPPVITFQTPPKYAVNVPLNNNVTIRITDNQSGVDISKTLFEINGEIYTTQSPEVSYLGQLLDYTFVIKPRVPFYADKESVIKVTTIDKAGNKSTDTNVFNIPATVLKEKICPDAQAGGTTLTSSGTGSGTNSSDSQSQGDTTTVNTNGSTGNTSNNLNTSNNNLNQVNSTTDTTRTSNFFNNLTGGILARTGGSIQDFVMHSYWWGIPLLLVIFILVVVGRHRWLKKEIKPN